MSRLVTFDRSTSDFTEKIGALGHLAGKRVAVVGGGQSGAEIVRSLICDDRGLPRRISWFTRGSRFPIFDESVLANDLYTPGFAKSFYKANEMRRRSLNKAYKTSSDGIVNGILQAVSQRLYELDVLEGTPVERDVRIDHEFTELHMRSDGDAELRFCTSLGAGFACVADIVVFATGYRLSRTGPIASVQGLLARSESGGLILNPDYSAALAERTGGALFLQNYSVDRYGWMDPNLGGTSWRSATIANAILGYEAYRNGDDGGLIDWSWIEEQGDG